MLKTVDKNSRDTVVELDGGECEVVFSAKYSAFALMNNGAADVVMSTEEGKTETDDGVRIVGSGESAVIAAPMLSDKLYVTGAGRVQIAALMGLTNPFKPAAKGGGGGSGGGGDVSKEYVDARDAVTLAAAKRYADEKTVTLEPATATKLGGVMVGDGLEATVAGKLSAPLATEAGISAVVDNKTASDTEVNELMSLIFDT